MRLNSFLERAVMVIVKIIRYVSLAIMSLGGRGSKLGFPSIFRFENFQMVSASRLD